MTAEERSPSMSESTDDFTHLTAERCLTSSVSLLSKSLYGQVVFHDLGDVYPTDCDIKCRYSLTDYVNPQPGDKIALFKVGWLSVSEYITFVRAQLPSEAESTILQVSFSADTLPKDDDVYQLCYVTSGNVIAGASTPFGFRKPHESEFIAVEDPTDPGLIVFKSRVTQLQDDLNKVMKEKDILNDKSNRLEQDLNKLNEEMMGLLAEKEKYENTTKDLTEMLETVKKDKDTYETAAKDLETMLKVLREEKEQYEKSEKDLKKQLEDMLKEKEDLMESLSDSTYEKVLENMKEELRTLDNEKNLIQQKFVEKSNELKSCEASIDCLKQDIINMNKNLKERVILNEVQNNEITLMKEKLKTFSELHNTSVAEKMILSEEILKKNNMIEDLRSQLERSSRQFDEFYRHKTLGDLRVALLVSEDEKALLQAQLNSQEEFILECTKNAERVSEPEEVTALKNEIDLLKRKLKEEGETIKTEETEINLFDTSPEAGCSKDDNTSKINSLILERASVREKLVEVRHENQELNRIYKEITEENAALKSRIGVLEYELSKCKSQRKSSLNKSQNTSEALNVSSSNEKLSEVVDKFIENIPVIEKFNSIVSNKLNIEQLLEQETKLKVALQKKVENLMLKDSILFSQLQKEREECKQLKAKISEMESLLSNITDKSVNPITDLTMVELKLKLEKTLKEKECIEEQLLTLRKETIGRVYSLEKKESFNEELDETRKLLLTLD